MAESESRSREGHDIATDAISSPPLEVLGRIPRSSNTTLLATIELDGSAVPVVYKPARGERPLWDFPRGTLCRREVASYVVSEALGWHLVPPTVLRDGPFGLGSVQLFVETDEAVDMVEIVESADPVLKPMAVLDLIVNNADRKIGHCILDTAGHLWGIDHGLTFHDEPKLRTVLWEWMGEEIPDELHRGVRHLADLLDCGEPPLPELSSLLLPVEIRALRRRIREITVHGVFPEPDPFGPALPWPPW